MNDAFRDMLSDLLPLLVPFLSATLLSVLSFLLERIHPELRDATSAHRKVTWERALEATSRYFESAALQQTDALAASICDTLYPKIQELIRQVVREELERALANNAAQERVES